MRDLIQRLGVIGFGTLFLVAFWFRVGNLEGIPEHNGDESYYGIQAERLERGETIALRTTSGNVLNPFLLGLALPLHAIATPSLTLLRLPAVVSGILAVVLMLTLGSKAFDRTTALIAATLLAVLPILVFESRMGLEMSQQPFFGVLAIALAFLGNEVGLLLALLASLLVHPTDVFLLPIAIPVYVVQVYQRYADDPQHRRRVLIRCGAATLILGVAASAWLLHSPTAQMNLRQRDPLHWRRFLDGVERLLFFLYLSVSPATMHLHRYLFRGVALVVFVVGLRGLVRERQTTRIVFLLCVAASLAGFHILAGPGILRRLATHRYGMVFVAPIVLAFAFLFRGFWPRAGTAVRGRVLPALGLLAMGGALLLSMKWNYFDRVAPPGGETFGPAASGVPDPFARTLAAIRQDMARKRSGPGGPPETLTGTAPVQQIVAHDYWIEQPLLYLAYQSPDVSVSVLIGLDSLRVPYTKGRYAAHEAWLRDRLRAGAYVVEHRGTPVPLGGKVIENVVNSSFAPESVRLVGEIEPGGFRIFKLDRQRGTGPASPLARVGTRSE